MNDKTGQLGDLLARWGSLAESSAQANVKSNLMLAKIFWVIRDAMGWNTVEMRRHFLRLASGNDGAYVMLERQLGKEMVG